MRTPNARLANSRTVSLRSADRAEVIAAGRSRDRIEFAAEADLTVAFAVDPLPPGWNVMSDAKPPCPGGRSMAPVSVPSTTSPLLSVTMLWPVKNKTVGTVGSPFGIAFVIVNA